MSVAFAAADDSSALFLKRSYDLVADALFLDRLFFVRRRHPPRRANRGRAFEFAEVAVRFKGEAAAVPARMTMVMAASFIILQFSSRARVRCQRRGMDLQDETHRR